MTIQYDLHSHSVASDGTLSAADLVGRARVAGVDVLALTDHDTTDGVAEARAAALRVGLILVPGVEVSVSWNGLTVHVVGLHVDPANETLERGLCGLRAFREWRAEEIGRRLEKAGVPGAHSGAKAYAQGRIIGRTHFAHYLVECGRAPSVRDVFRRYLVHNKPGYVPGQWASLEDALEWIHTAGGQAVIAHPARYRVTATKLGRLIGEFRECGGVGIEVVSGSHSPADVQRIGAVARSTGLLASRGSDYHGPENPWVELGRLSGLPADLPAVWDSDPWRAAQTRWRAA